MSEQLKHVEYASFRALQKDVVALAERVLILEARVEPPPLARPTPDVSKLCGCDSAFCKGCDIHGIVHTCKPKTAAPDVAGDVVERVATVLFQTDGDGPLGIWDELSEDIRGLYIEQAKAVIADMPNQFRDLTNMVEHPKQTGCAPYGFRVDCDENGWLKLYENDLLIMHVPTYQQISDYLRVKEYAQVNTPQPQPVTREDLPSEDEAVEIMYKAAQSDVRQSTITRLDMRDAYRALLAATPQHQPAPQGKALPSEDEAATYFKINATGSGVPIEIGSSPAFPATPQPAQEITTPLNGGIRQASEPSGFGILDSTSRESLPNNCERGDTQPQPVTRDELLNIIEKAIWPTDSITYGTDELASKALDAILSQFIVVRK